MPVVFITNQVFLHQSPADVNGLASRVLRKIDAMLAAQGIAAAEVQLDCDWSSGTRARYFTFSPSCARSWLLVGSGCPRRCACTRSSTPPAPGFRPSIAAC